MTRKNKLKKQINLLEIEIEDFKSQIEVCEQNIDSARLMRSEIRLLKHKWFEIKKQIEALQVTNLEKEVKK